jgi:hypothetical protein
VGVCVGEGEREREREREREGGEREDHRGSFHQNSPPKQCCKRPLLRAGQVRRSLHSDG